MLEGTEVLCNTLHRGCQSMGNARQGYTSRVRDLSSKANRWGKKKNGLALTDINTNVWAVGSGAELSPNVV